MYLGSWNNLQPVPDEPRDQFAMSWQDGGIKSLDQLRESINVAKQTALERLEDIYSWRTPTTADEDEVIRLYRVACDRFRVRTMDELRFYRLPHPQNWTGAQKRYMLGDETTLEAFLRGPDDDPTGPPGDDFWTEREQRWRWSNPFGNSGTRTSSTHSRLSHRSGNGATQRSRGRQQNDRGTTFTIKYNCKLEWKVGLPTTTVGDGAHADSPKRRSTTDEWPWRCYGEKRQRMTVTDHRLTGWPQCEQSTDQIKTNVRQLLLHPMARAALLECVAYSCVADVREWLQKYFPTCDEPAPMIGP